MGHKKHASHEQKRLHVHALLYNIAIKGYHVRSSRGTGMVQTYVQL